MFESPTALKHGSYSVYEIYGNGHHHHRKVNTTLETQQLQNFVEQFIYNMIIVLLTATHTYIR